LPPIKFLALDGLRTKPLNERLRHIGGSSKLVYDVLQFDNMYSRMVLYCVANTLIFDTLDEARRVCFSDVRQKGVTLDGTLINKNGNITGGFDERDIASKSHKWDDKEYETIKVAKEKCAEELSTLERDHEVTMRREVIEQELQSAKRNSELINVDLQNTNQKIKRFETEIANVDVEIRSLRPKIQSLESAISSSEQPLHKLQGRINAVQDEVFKEFSRSVGVTSIREYEEKRLTRTRQRAEQKKNLTVLRAKIENQLQYEKSRDMKAPSERLQKSIEADQKQLKDLKKELKQSKASLKELEAAIANDKKSADALKEELQEKETEAKELKKQLNAIVKKLGEIKKQITNQETTLEQLKSRRHTAFQRCAVEQVDLPLLEGEEEEEEEAADPMDIEPSQASSKAREQSDERKAVAIDYTDLEDELKEVTDPAEHDRALQKLQAEIKTIGIEMERIAPNLNALHRLEDVNDRLKETMDEFLKAKAEGEKATAKFDEIKRERYDRFMAAFNHVSQRIDDIYKDLTKSNLQPLGGTAYLSLEDTDEPYNQGIKYNAMPPLKRFRDMDQLSGGEKTVAALALLFGIHSYQPSPFFVLDEIDAALDNVNVTRVANYIREQAEQSVFQAVVISLKDTFYEKAEALIGIYKDTEVVASRTLSLDLNQYEP